MPLNLQVIRNDINRFVNTRDDLNADPTVVFGCFIPSKGYCEIHAIKSYFMHNGVNDLFNEAGSKMYYIIVVNMVRGNPDIISEVYELPPKNVKINDIFIGRNAQKMFCVLSPEFVKSSGMTLKIDDIIREKK